MADSNAERSRRKRLHAAGDHSECTARCPAGRMRLAPVPPPALPAAGSIADAVLDFTAACKFAPEDARTPIAHLAVRLARQCDADPENMRAAAELGRLLAWLSEHPASPPDAIDEIQARRLARRAGSMLREPQ
jgi:hypothetical protein